MSAQEGIVGSGVLRPEIADHARTSGVGPVHSVAHARIRADNIPASTDIITGIVRAAAARADGRLPMYRIRSKACCFGTEHCLHLGFGSTSGTDPEGLSRTIFIDLCSFAKKSDLIGG